MVEDVAVVDVFAGEVEEAGADDDLAERRDRVRVFPGVGIDRLAVDRDDLEIVDVDVERVGVGAGVTQDPLLRRPEGNPLVDPVVLAQLAVADALGNAHMLGTLRSPYGVVAIPPEIFGHLLPLFIQAAPGVVFNGDPPFSSWEHPPALGRIPPHRSDAGAYLLAECFGCATITLIKDVDGLYDRDPKEHPNACFIHEITVAELRERNLPTLPFDRALLDLLEHARLVTRIQIINGLEPDRLEGALRGERVGTIVRQDGTA